EFANPPGGVLPMDRRAFLKTSFQLSAIAVTVAAPRRGHADRTAFDPRPGTWRTFDVTTRVEVLEPRGVTRLWLPVPSVTSDYQQTGDSKWSGNARVMQLMTDPKYGARMLYAEFAEGEAAPKAELVSRVRVQSRAGR